MNELTEVKFEVREQIARLLFNRPQARNALSPRVRLDIDACLGEIKADAGEDIRALVVTGAGPVRLESMSAAAAGIAGR